MQLLTNFFKKKENLTLVVLSFLLGTIAFLYLAPKTAILPFLKISSKENVFHSLYFIFSALAFGAIFFLKEKISWLDILKSIVILYFPTEVLFLYGLQKLSNLNSLIGVFSAAYVFLLTIFIINLALKITKIKKNDFCQEVKSRKPFFQQKILALIILSAVMLINFSFGVYHLGKFAAVDEPLWTFDRIPDFWKNIKEGNWYNARVSDKPGLTVAVISGAGLLFEPNPKSFKSISWNGQVFTNNKDEAINRFNFIFRFPIFLFTVLAIPLFYWLIYRLINERVALFSIIFIGLSPILIGNSQIINPDSLLWVFSFVSILTYFIYLKDENQKFLIASALFLALAILTKYTVNILYIFYFGMIFVNYLFDTKKQSRPFHQYLRKRILDYFLLVFISLALFYIIYPAVWEKPSRVFIGTIYSQAFESVWPLFAGILGAVLADLLIFKSFIASNLFKFLLKIRKILWNLLLIFFIVSIAAVFVNVYSKMKFFDLESILASPKSTHSYAGSLGIFLADFYPLVFGISSIALTAIVVFILKILSKEKIAKENYQFFLYVILFILLYYIGSVFSHVASIIRYQIILFPLIFLMSGIALEELLNPFLKKFKNYRYPLLITVVLLFIFLGISLYQTKPFYMGYASFLLPRNYALDIKDMGEGSYEAADYLNSLPRANQLSIWTDKKGVCTFFVGTCYDSLDSNQVIQLEIDYFVISSGRASRTAKIAKKSSIFSLQDLYSGNYPAEFELLINGRTSNYVKIIKAENVFKQ